MIKTIDAHDARVRFGQLLNEVGEKNNTFFVKRRGKMAAIIMSPDEYMDLFEIAAEINDPELQKALAKTEKEFELGEVGTEEDIFKILKGE